MKRQSMSREVYNDLKTQLNAERSVLRSLSERIACWVEPGNERQVRVDGGGDEDHYGKAGAQRAGGF